MTDDLKQILKGARRFQEEMEQQGFGDPRKLRIQKLEAENARLLAQLVEMGEIAIAYRDTHDAFFTNLQADRCECPLCQRCQKALAAAEIAKVVEQIQHQLDARRELNDELRAENTQLLAQLAEMREALELAGNAITYPEQYSLASVIETINKALAAAPEVLCSGEGKIKHTRTDEMVPRELTKIGVEGCYPWRYRGKLIGKDDQRVRAIIISAEDDEKEAA